MPTRGVGNGGRLWGQAARRSEGRGKWSLVVDIIVLRRGMKGSDLYFK